MGCFAVIRDPDEPTFDIDSCHLNLWSLSGLFGRRVFLWDVGLILEAAAAGADNEVSTIKLLLPFGTEPEAFTDLSREIMEPNVARLLFGKSVTVNEATKTISYTGAGASSALRVVPVQKAEIDEDFEKDKGLRRANLSLWSIKFATRIKHGQKAYVRVRFRMRTLGRTWLWMRSKLGALVDIRVADIREIVIPSEGGAKLAAYGEQFVAISKLHVFVIVPGYLLFKATSPALHYMRLFEGRVWEHYLGGRAVDWSRSDKLMIYQWRGHPDDPANPGKVTPVTATDPFRVFLIVSREHGAQTLLTILLTTALVLSGVYLLLHPQYIRDGYAEVERLAAKLGYPLGGATLLLFLGWLAKNLGPVRRGFSKAWKLFRDFEDWVFHLRSRIGL